MAKARSLVQIQRIENAIMMIRQQRVMLDADLADLYGTETKVLVQAIKRSLSRFPKDFMFQLTKQEFTILRSQSVTSRSWGGRRTPPYAFTEQGVAMLSSVLNSKKAVDVNVEIMRTFVRVREILSSTENLGRRLRDLENKCDEQFEIVFEAIKKLMENPEEAKRIAGFTPKKKT